MHTSAFFVFFAIERKFLKGTLTNTEIGRIKIESQLELAAKIFGNDANLLVTVATNLPMAVQDAQHKANIVTLTQT